MQQQTSQSSDAAGVAAKHKLELWEKERQGRNRKVKFIIQQQPQEKVSVTDL